MSRSLRAGRLGAGAALLAGLLAIVPGAAPAGAQEGGAAATATPESAAATAESGQEGAAAAAQESEPESQFFESIDVNVVNIDVFVTDKKGNRIRGLGKDDFELYQNGQPVAITNFYAVEDGKPVATPLVAEVGDVTVETPEPAAPAAPVEAEEVPEEQRLYLVVYIDNWNIKPFNRNRVFRGIRHFLRTQLTPGDHVMLQTYDRATHVRRPFTSDPVTIASALFEIEKLSANGGRLESDRNEAMRTITAQEMRGGNKMIAIRSYAQSLANDVEFSIDALRETVNALSGLPGRKAVLYVSDGIEMVPGEDVFYALQQEDETETSAIMESRTYDMSRRFNELVAAANSSRVSFYTLDAAGLRAPSAASVESRNPGATGQADSIYFGNLQATIRLMADATGGRAIFNTNDPSQGLTLVAEDFRNYYSLGFSPSTQGSGRYHEIKVKLADKEKDKEYVVHNREGYRDKPFEARMGESVAAALLFDVGGNPLGIEIERGEERPRDDGNYLVPISVRIPIGGLTLLPQGATYLARTRLFIGAVDEKGGRSEVQEARVPIEVPEAELDVARASTWRYDLTLAMRRGVQKLAVALRDEFGQVSSFAIKTIRVGG